MARAEEVAMDALKSKAKIEENAAVREARTGRRRVGVEYGSGVKDASDGSTQITCLKVSLYRARCSFFHFFLPTSLAASVCLPSHLQSCATGRVFQRKPPPQLTSPRAPRVPGVTNC